MNTDLLTFLGVILSAALGLTGIVYTARQGRRVVEAETARQDERDRQDAEGLTFTKADAINDRIVKRLEGDIARIAHQSAEREAYFVEAERRHRDEIEQLRARAERAEEKARTAAAEATEARRSLELAERAIRSLQSRLDAIEGRRTP